MSAEYRMPEPCVDCPFNEAGPGRKLRDSLQRGRFASIKRDLKAGKHFTCHKTTDETGNGTNLVCAGSIEWQARHRIVADYVKICERLAIIRQRRPVL